MHNALAVDLEEWHSNDFLTGYLPEEKEDQIVESVIPLMALLDSYRTRATFSVLGTVAERHPDLIRKIYDRGHEIASHACSHRTLHELGRDKFEQEIVRSVRMLEAITGEKPIGFRAPNFSINHSTAWAFDILERHGFRYDASIFPLKTTLYGVPEAPLGIYRPSRANIAKHDPEGRIVEFPATVLKLGVKVPISGGFYLRLLPRDFLKWGIERVNRTRPAILYIHPWELYPRTPRLQMPAINRFEAYCGINSSMNKLEALLNAFEFRPIRDVLFG
ncbi:MAG TPA: polysaccharide deacetylase family protein [Methanocella sp.]|nr:polysaccharide deacetylase family protein [Methanocella sp.]